jgi:hypothetical protein
MPQDKNSVPIVHKQTSLKWGRSTVQSVSSALVFLVLSVRRNAFWQIVFWSDVMELKQTLFYSFVKIWNLKICCVFPQLGSITQWFVADTAAISWRVLLAFAFCLCYYSRVNGKETTVNRALDGSIYPS